MPVIFLLILIPVILVFIIIHLNNKAAREMGQVEKVPLSGDTRIFITVLAVFEILICIGFAGVYWLISITGLVVASALSTVHTGDKEFFIRITLTSLTVFSSGIICPILAIIMGKKNSLLGAVVFLIIPPVILVYILLSFGLIGNLN